MGKSSLEVEILGTSFTVQSDADPRHLARVVEYLKSKVKAIQVSFSHYEPMKVCLLAGLNVVDELFQARNPAKPENPAELVNQATPENPDKLGHSEGPEAREIERITESLIEKIDRSLLET
jgi:cell division protein ZapA (FtsZ GTPase activity inhibitor)